MRCVGVIAALAVSAAALSACGSGADDRKTAPSSAATTAASSSAAISSAPRTDEETTATPADGQQACTDLRDTKALRSALGFVIVANVVEPGDVSETVSDLQNILDEAPLDYSPPISRIIQVLQAIDEGARAGDGREVDTYTMEPDAKELVKMCHADKFPVPKLG